MKREVKTKKITIDELAMMVAKGFENTATKTDVEGLKEEIKGVKKDIEGVKNQLEGTNKRIDDLASNRVKYEDHNKLKARVDFIEEKLEIEI